MRERTRRMLPAIALVLAGCESQYPPPEGFVAACYGGDYEKNLNGKIPTFSLYVDARQEDWPQVARRIQPIGQRRELKYFDTSIHEPGVNTLAVWLCSDRGLMVNADKQIWKSAPDPGPDALTIHLYVYDGRYDWRPVAQDLQRAFSDWPKPVRAVPSSTATAGTWPNGP